MYSEIEKMVTAFEAGKMSRRDLIVRLGTFVSALAGAGRIATASQTEASTFSAVGLDHIALNVSDVPRSRDFYVKHLGLTVRRQHEEQSCFMGCGDHFVALFRDSKPGMDHYCYAIKDYDASNAVEKLQATGLEPRRTANRVYFNDPDAITVQVAAGSDRS